MWVCSNGFGCVDSPMSVKAIQVKEGGCEVLCRVVTEDSNFGAFSCSCVCRYGLSSGESLKCCADGCWMIDGWMDGCVDWWMDGCKYG